MNHFRASYAINSTSQQLTVNTWEPVQDILKRLRTAKSGWLTLTCVPQQPFGPQESQVIMERQNYHMMLGELVHDHSGDHGLT